MSSRIAILMPVYEPNPDHLREAIESVQSQTLQDWTLFIRDDEIGRASCRERV